MVEPGNKSNTKRDVVGVQLSLFDLMDYSSESPCLIFDLGGVLQQAYYDAGYPAIDAAWDIKNTLIEAGFCY